MRNGYDDEDLHHHHHHHHPHSIHDNQRRAPFMPMFCRLSIKDVKQSNLYRDPIITSAAAAGEPSSPRVSCIGQVKRNNRVIGFPAAVTASNHHKQPIKLNKLFSTKTLLPNPTTAKSAASRGCRTSRESNSRRSRTKADCDQANCVKAVDIGKMDPPLPVVRRVAPPGVGRDEVNIWKRRFNAAAVKSLQIEPIHLPSNKFESPPTTV